MAEMITQLKIISTLLLESILEKYRWNKITYEIRTNEVERELTIYLTQYIMEMYKDYLGKKKKSKEVTNNDGMIHESANNDQLMDLEEESKNGLSKPLKSGDKYIIRKLISLKISVEHIQEYIDMLTSGWTGVTSGINPYTFSNTNMIYNSMPMEPPVQTSMETPVYLNPPMHGGGHHRSNSLYANNPVQIQQVSNFGFMDDSKLIPNHGKLFFLETRCNLYWKITWFRHKKFWWKIILYTPNLLFRNLKIKKLYIANNNGYNAMGQYMNMIPQHQNGIGQYQFPTQDINENFERQMNLFETNSNASLDNNFSVNNEPLSSLPLHLRNRKPVRSNSITQLPKSSKYMQESFLFDKITASNSKDDNILQKDHNQIHMEEPEQKKFIPTVLKFNRNLMGMSDWSSPRSQSSQSSVFSYGDSGGSASSLDISFDGSGLPYLKPARVSAFAKLK